MMSDGGVYLDQIEERVKSEEEAFELAKLSLSEAKQQADWYRRNAGKLARRIVSKLETESDEWRDRVARVRAEVAEELREEQRRESAAKAAQDAKQSEKQSEHDRDAA